MRHILPWLRHCVAERIVTDDTRQEDMLTILTAADVELDMDDEVEEVDIIDDESGDEMD
jgi:hypothetical protein